MITKTLFDTYCGRDVNLYTISCADIKVGVLDFGGILNFIKLNTSQGEKNILVGYDCIQGYIENKESYCGVTIGRVANRIAGAKFALEGKEYTVSANEGQNCRHGGVEGFDGRFYDAAVNDNTLTLSLTSPDGDMGFPGELQFKVEFTLKNKELTIRYRGLSNKTTLFAPTCHTYFNLEGEGEVIDNFLQIHADNFTPVDESLIPLGTIAPVKGTPLDFTKMKTIGRDYAKLNSTYDHNFCLNNSSAAVAFSKKSGIIMKITTDLKGLQLYVGKTATYKGKGGGCGFCLEPQFYPNAVNVEGFETPILPANTERNYSIRYAFYF